MVTLLHKKADLNLVNLNRDGEASITAKSAGKNGKALVKSEPAYYFELKGLWWLIFYYDAARTDLWQKDLIDFKGGASDIGIPLENPTTNATWNQRYQVTGEGMQYWLVLTSNLWSNIGYWFILDPSDPDPSVLIGRCGSPTFSWDLCSDSAYLELRRN